jgi:hypothetical protein
MSLPPLVEDTPDNKRGQRRIRSGDAPASPQGKDLEDFGECSQPANTTQGLLQLFVSGFALATWNTIALFAQVQRSSLSRARTAMVHSLSYQAQIFSLQETHGNAADFILMRGEFSDFLVLGFQHASPAAGGVLTLIATKLLILPQAVFHRIVEEGRCTATVFYTIFPITSRQSASSANLQHYGEAAAFFIHLAYY